MYISGTVTHRHAFISMESGPGPYTFELAISCRNGAIFEYDLEISCIEIVKTSKINENSALFSMIFLKSDYRFGMVILHLTIFLAALGNFCRVLTSFILRSRVDSNLERFVLSTASDRQAMSEGDVIPH